MNNKKSIELIHSLSEAPGASGFEDQVIEVAKSFSPSLEWEIDSLKNLYLYQDKSSKKPRILLDAHLDEVGFMVQFIRPDGLLDIIPLGGWNPFHPYNSLVSVRGEKGYIEGIIISKPPHFMTPFEKNHQEIPDRYLVDLGVRSKNEIDKWGIEPGAPVVPYSPFVYNENSKIMRGKAFDNRLGCALVLEILQSTSLKNYTLVGALASQEEVGIRGASLTAERVNPSLAIVFEGSPSDDFFTAEHERQGALGGGVQIRLKDQGYISHEGMVQQARRLAEEHKIPHQLAVRTGGSTNASKISLSRLGVPVLVLGIPSRYVHTHYGYASIEDYCATRKLAESYLHHVDETFFEHR